DSEQDAERALVKPQPLGPAWFPTHVSAQPASGPPPDTAEAIAVPVGPGSNTATSNAPSATGGARPQAAVSGATAKSFNGYQVGPQPDVYPSLQASLHNFNVIELSGADSFGALCGPSGARPLPPLIISPRHIAAEPACKSQHYPRIL